MRIGTLADASKNGVRSMIIYTTTPAAILLFEQKHRRREWALTGPDEASIEHRSHMSFQFGFLAVRVSVWLHVDKVRMGKEMDKVSDGAMGGR